MAGAGGVAERREADADEEGVPTDVAGTVPEVTVSVKVDSPDTGCPSSLTTRKATR